MALVCPSSSSLPCDPPGVLGQFVVLPSGPGLSIALGSLAIQGAPFNFCAACFSSAPSYSVCLWVPGLDLSVPLPSHGDLGTFYLFFLPLLGVGGSVCSPRASLTDGLATYPGGNSRSAGESLCSQDPGAASSLSLAEAACEGRQSRTERCGVSRGPGG